MNLLRRIRAFVIRDFQLALSYRVEFFLRLVWILGIVTTFYFISRIFASVHLLRATPMMRDFSSN